MVDNDGGIDIQVQPLTGTRGHTRGPRAGASVRAGSPDTGQRAASTSRQIMVDEARRRRRVPDHRTVAPDAGDAVRPAGDRGARSANTGPGS
jgi:hypothetical protein